MEKVYHGISTSVTISESDILFKDLPKKFEIGRYHSWVVATPLPNELIATSFDDEGHLMSLRHKTYDVRSVQYHPESILTPNGKNIRKLDKKLVMKTTLKRLTNYESLSKNEAKEIITNIAEGKFNNSQIASFLTVFMMRNISLEELEGFREALLELCISVDLSEFNTIDLCGTGGDGKDTFNISTLSSFVTAGAGIKVTKHGNYGVSSGCGSSNVLEALGIKFSNNKDFLKRCLEKA